MRPGTSNHWWNAQQFDRDRSAFQCSATLIARLGAEPWRPAAPEPDSRVSSVKGLTVIEPNLDRVWAALTTGARLSRTPFTVLQLATSGLDDAPKVRSVILRRRRAGRRLVLHRRTFGESRRDTAPAAGFSHRLRCGRRISNPSGGQGDHRHGGSGKGCGLGDLSISYPRALPASAAFREPNQRSSRSCAR